MNFTFVKCFRILGRTLLPSGRKKPLSLLTSEPKKDTFSGFLGLEGLSIKLVSSFSSHAHKEHSKADHLEI